MTHTLKRSLKVGLFIGLFEGFSNGHTSRWPEIADMARHAEQVGFDSIWLPDHFFIRDSPEQEPIGVWECTAMVAALAAITTTVELGTLVLCTSFRNPVMLAKLADTIDEISGGRLILGLGAGRHDPEYEALGIPTDHRYSRFAEAFEIISRLLREGSIDFEGHYYQARECVLRPRAGRPGGPPIMVGAHGRSRMLNLTAKYADMWNAFLLRGSSRVEDLMVRIEQLDAACYQIRRDLHPDTHRHGSLERDQP